MPKNLSKGHHAHTPSVYGINEILAEIRQKSLTEKEKGTDFERLMKLWFMTDSRYILDLLLSVINVSVQTVNIVNSLPKLKFD